MRHSKTSSIEYQHHIQQWQNKGPDFKTFLYVPEVHLMTKEVFCEREDEAHACTEGMYMYVFI